MFSDYMEYGLECELDALMAISSTFKFGGESSDLDLTSCYNLCLNRLIFVYFLY